MKRLIKKADIDLLKYKDKFEYSDSDITTGQDRGGDTISVSVIMKLNRTNEDDKQWDDVCNALIGLDTAKAIDLVGKQEIEGLLENYGAEYIDRIDQDCYNKTDQAFEYVFSTTNYKDNDDNEFRR